MTEQSPLEESIANHDTVSTQDLVNSLLLHLAARSPSDTGKKKTYALYKSALARLYPAPILKALNKPLVRRAQVLVNPLLAEYLVDIFIVYSALDRLVEYLGKGDAGPQEISNLMKHGLVHVVADRQAIVTVVQNETLRDGLNCVAKRGIGLLAFCDPANLRAYAAKCLY